ncbi:MAG: hypothetical protein KKA07_17595 [Bacteroidetes bacterium]|nr:hypothetical protein [Bacteroidota bacterium]MBU1720885.1 hypothetical protein [Bacteroidota bacterium]
MVKQSRKTILGIRMLLTLLCAMLVRGSNGQILHFFPLETQIFRYENLWEIQVNIANPRQYNHFFVSIEVSRDNTVILRAKSKAIAAQTITNNLIAGNFKLSDPSGIFWENNFLALIKKNGGYFPAGEYNVSFQLSATTLSPLSGYVEEVLFSNEAPIVVHGILPPALVTVFDNDTVETATPLFTWIPVGTNWIAATYTFKLVDVLNCQCPETAIIENKAIFQESTGFQCFLNYPGNAAKLESGKKYAWQVSAIIDNNVYFSEIWSFIYTNELKNEDNDDSVCSYTTTSENPLSNQYVMKNAILPIQLQSRRKSGIIKYSVKNNTLQDVSESFRMKNAKNTESPLEYKAGNNWFYLECRKKNDPGVYFVEISGYQAEASQIQFLIK